CGSNLLWISYGYGSPRPLPALPGGDRGRGGARLERGLPSQRRGGARASARAPGEGDEGGRPMPAERRKGALGYNLIDRSPSQMPSQVAALQPGTKLGAYVIEACLGAGGMGAVYRARDQRLGRVVAIKVLPPDFATTLERRQRFEREARILSSLNHPHICVLYDVGGGEGLDYLVMEHVSGMTLAAVLA